MEREREKEKSENRHVTFKAANDNQFIIYTAV